MPTKIRFLDFAFFSLIFFPILLSHKGLALAGPPAEIFMQTGHSNSVSSVSFSPDGKTVASGSWDNTAKIWEADTGQIKISITLLPGNEWIAFNPEKLFYNSSLQGDEYGAIRFENRLSPLYPLEYYRKDLKRGDLDKALQETQPAIEPKPLRLWWERLENKGAWFGGIASALLAFAVMGFLLVRLVRRSDPMETAKRFFAGVKPGRVETLSRKALLLRPEEGQTGGLIVLWEEGPGAGAERISLILKEHKKKVPEKARLYLAYKGNGPSGEIIWTLRRNLGREIIPIYSPVMEQALAVDACPQTLKELEEPYLTRLDPYSESKPINDPNWFYGRDDFLQRLPALLAQGQHAGIFGLRKVGKTSLINQLRQRFTTTPVVFMDCQAFTARAEIYFEEILRQLCRELSSLGIKGLPAPKKAPDVEGFRLELLRLFGLWKKTGKENPFLIILDEIDKFFPARYILGSEDILAEYVRFFRALRGLAQESCCLVAVVVAYRPDVNRHNSLTERVGENPMYKSFQEEHLGFLSKEDSEAMDYSNRALEGDHLGKRGGPEGF